MARTKKAKGRRAPVQYQTYVFQIDGWTPSYSFAVNHAAWREGPYWEYLALTVTGRIVSPSKFKDRAGQLVLLGNREDARKVEEPPSSDWRPNCVGSLTIRGRRTEYLGSIPHDSLWGVVGMLNAGALRFVDLTGEALRYGTAMIQTISFSRELDPENLE